MKDKIWYMAHPYTSIGSKDANIIYSLYTQHHLRDKHNLLVINPLIIVPQITHIEETAIRVCDGLQSICQGLILTGEWFKSKGCLHELENAKKLKQDIMIWNGEELITDIEKVNQIINKGGVSNE